MIKTITFSGIRLPGLLSLETEIILCLHLQNGKKWQCDNTRVYWDGKNYISAQKGRRQFSPIQQLDQMGT